MSEAIDNQDAFLLDFCLLIAEAHRQGFQVTSGELLRTLEQQAIYVKQGRSKTMLSNHLEKLAGDLNFFKDGVWINGLPNAREILKPLGAYWESLNPLNKWGGNFKTFIDCPHFQRGKS